MTAYKFSRVSRNSKLGPIPMVMSSPDTCPHSCPLKGQGCYAEQGPTLWQWRKTRDSFEETCANIRALPEGTLWRYGVAGDLPHTDGRIDTDALDALVKANHQRRGWLYTHHDTTIQWNQEAIAGANARGLTINLSADSLEVVDRKYALGIGPVVTILPRYATKVTYTQGGVRVVTCPNVLNKQITCSNCRICQRSDRRAVIGFPVHGVRWKKAEQVFAERS